MPHATADDGVKLYFDETGSGKLVVFVHEFAGNNQSWELQMRHFGRRYRCVAFAARGYPIQRSRATEFLFTATRG